MSLIAILGGERSTNAEEPIFILEARVLEEKAFERFERKVLELRVPDGKETEKKAHLAKIDSRKGMYIATLLIQKVGAGLEDTFRKDVFFLLIPDAELLTQQLAADQIICFFYRDESGNYVLSTLPVYGAGLYSVLSGSYLSEFADRAVNWLNRRVKVEQIKDKKDFISMKSSRFAVGKLN